ncbi:MAG: SpoIIE family protein phosphatase [Clostridia bacterium]
MTERALPRIRSSWSALETRGAPWAGLAALGLVLGQAALYHRPAPFAWGMLVVVWSVDRQDYAPALLGAVAGTFIGSGLMPALLLAVLGLALLTLGSWRFRPPLAVLLGGLGSLGLLAVAIPWSLAASPLALLAAGVGGATVWLGLHGWRYVSEPHPRRDPLGTTLALFCFAAVVAGMEAIHVGGWWPGITLGALVVAAAAVVAGPAGGALAGATLGVTSAVAGGGVTDVGLLVVAGFGAGIAVRSHWRWSGLGLLAGFAAYALYLQTPARLTPLSLSLAVGVALFSILPKAVLSVLKDWIQPLTDGGQERAKTRLPKVAEVLEEMTGVLTWPDDDRHDPSPVELVVRDVCRRCSLYRRCWEDDFYRSYRAVQEQLKGAELDPVTPEDLGAYLNQVCIKAERMADSINTTAGRSARAARRRHEMAEVRSTVHAHLKSLSALITDMAEDLERESVSRPVGPRLSITAAAAKRPRTGGQVSGDTALIQELYPGRYVVGLSDGMGMGPEAALESGAAVNLLAEVLRRGFSQSLAVRVVNSALVFRSSEERFATLDLTLFDLDGYRAEVLKVAAPPTFWRRNNHVDAIRVEGLPIGILREVRHEPVYHSIEPGDVVAMVTDGALGPPDSAGEETFLELFRSIPVTRADVMAESLLHLMEERLGPRRDDAAVLVAVIGKVRARMPVHVEGQIIGEWRRVTR